MRRSRWSARRGGCAGATIRGGESSVANPAELTASSELGSITPTQLPHLKRSFRGYSRKAVHKMYAQVMAEIDQSHRTVVAQLEHDKATIRQDQELLEEKLTQAIRRQKSLVIFHATAQEQRLSSNWPLINDKITRSYKDTSTK